MIKYHTVNLLTIAEMLPDSEIISSPEEMLDLIANISFNSINDALTRRDN